MSNVVRLAGRSRLHSQLAWRSVARGTARADAGAAEVVATERRETDAAQAAHADAVSCRGGFYAAPRGGKLLPWHAAKPAPVVPGRREWSNGVLGMNLGMSAVEGEFALQAIGIIMLAGLGVVLACLLVYLLEVQAFSGSSAPQASQIYGMAEPVQQAQAVAGSYQVAGGVIGDWLASAGDAYRASWYNAHFSGGLLGLGTGDVNGRAAVMSRD